MSGQEQTAAGGNVRSGWKADVQSGKPFNSISVEMCLTAANADLNSNLFETRFSVEATAAVTALSALAQEHRLALFRRLVQAGENGMAAGAIAQALGVPNSSLSFHLSQLSQAGLISHRRQHRSLIYSADYAAMNALVGYLMENCCAGAGCAVNTACAEALPMQERTIA